MRPWVLLLVGVIGIASAVAVFAWRSSPSGPASPAVPSAIVIPWPRIGDASRYATPEGPISFEWKGNATRPGVDARPTNHNVARVEGIPPSAWLFDFPAGALDYAQEPAAPSPSGSYSIAKPALAACLLRNAAQGQTVAQVALMDGSSFCPALGKAGFAAFAASHENGDIKIRARNATASLEVVLRDGESYPVSVRVGDWIASRESWTPGAGGSLQATPVALQMPTPSALEKSLPADGQHGRFLLRDAAQRLSSDPQARDLQTWIAAHPSAVPVQAAYAIHRLGDPNDTCASQAWSIAWRDDANEGMQGTVTSLDACSAPSLPALIEVRRDDPAGNERPQPFPARMVVIADAYKAFDLAKQNATAQIASATFTATSSRVVGSDGEAIEVDSATGALRSLTRLLS